MDPQLVVVTPAALLVVLVVVVFLQRRPFDPRLMTAIAAVLMGLSLVLALALGESGRSIAAVAIGVAVWLAVVHCSSRAFRRMADLYADKRA